MRALLVRRVKLLTNNYFEIFNISEDFDIDLEALALRYRELQGLVHPDKFANASESEKRQALQKTTEINEAHETLKNPLLRAIYILKIKGIDIDQENVTTHDGQFLMQQMELRETLSKIKTSSDALEKLEDFSKEVEVLTSDQISQIRKMINQNNPDSLKVAAESIFKLQFLMKLNVEVEMLEEELEELI